MIPIETEITTRLGELDDLLESLVADFTDLVQQLDELGLFIDMLKDAKRKHLSEWCHHHNIDFARLQELRRLSGHAQRIARVDKRILEGLGLLPKIVRARPKRHPAANNLVSKVADLTELLALLSERGELTDLDKTFLAPLTKYTQ